MAITDKNFPAFVKLMERVKANFTHISGQVLAIHADWSGNGNLNIQVTLDQQAPKSRHTPYTVHVKYDPYFRGPWGPGGWKVSDYEGFRGGLALDANNDSLLKPNQTPYTRGFGEEWSRSLQAKHGKWFDERMVNGYPNREEWDGQRLLAGADYQVLID